MSGSKSDQITPGERRELRSVVRQQMKVLRTEVKQRKDEMYAEVEARLVEKYREDDRLHDEMQQKLRRIADDANRQLEDLLGDYGQVMTGQWQMRRDQGFTPPWIRRKDSTRDELRAAMQRGVDSQCRSAELALDRQEADLLRDLAVDALETEAARSFLGRIPSVGELVPSRRLREIESAFDAAQEPT